MATVTVSNNGAGSFFLTGKDGVKGNIYSPAWCKNANSAVDLRMHFSTKEVAIKWARFCGYSVQDGEKILKPLTVNHAKQALSWEGGVTNQDGTRNITSIKKVNI